MIQAISDFGFVDIHASKGLGDIDLHRLSPQLHKRAHVIRRVAYDFGQLDGRTIQYIVSGGREAWSKTEQPTRCLPCGRFASDDQRIPQLSPREREVTHLMAEGLTADAIAKRLGVSVETVRTHVRNTIRKLRARNRVHAIAMALERGEIALSEAEDA